MAQIIIGIFAEPRVLTAVEGELSEAGAHQDDFSTIDTEVVGGTGDDVVDVLMAIGLPDHSILRYATAIDAGGIVMSVKDATLSAQEVIDCFTRRGAVDVQTITNAPVSKEHG